MSDPNESLSADDPRLTAYALGELEGAERELVEAAVHKDPMLQAAVADIRSFGGELAQTLETEDAAFSDSSSAAIQPNPPVTEEPGDRETSRRGSLLRFPALYYVFATAAAAGFAVMVALHSPTESPFRARQTLMQVHFGDSGATEPEGSNEAAAESTMVVAEASQRKAEVPQPPAMPEVEKRVALVQSGLPVRAAADLSVASRRRMPGSGFVPARDQPSSTFSIDVDTASYSDIRRLVNDGKLPPTDVVRIEELLNYFPYSYQPPARVASPGSTPPFSANLEVATAPWAPEHRLVRVALKGREVSAEERGPASLVFLIDVSGSMNAPNRLPLVKDSIRTLLNRLRGDDRVAIVTYAGESGLVLPATPVRQRELILASLENLQPEGSVQGSTGIQLAYEVAKANQAGPGLTRVVLCTDGDFNAGISDGMKLARLIEENARAGVSLTALGFGMGGNGDGTLRQLAERGRGTQGYVDSPREAERIMVEQVGDALATIARDVTIKVEFNPMHVAQYRLIGYENRGPVHPGLFTGTAGAEAFGSGHSVTALYEIIPSDAGSAGPMTPLAHGEIAGRSRQLDTGRELLTVRVGYKEPTGDIDRKLEFSLADGGQTFEQASPDFQFAASVAAFGMVLRESPLRGSATYATVSEWGTRGAANDPGGYRAEFLDLVKRAQRIVR